MGKTCAELFEGFECTILGDGGQAVCGLAYRSDQVRPNDAFFCIVGLTCDGHTFAQDAVDRGARVVVCEHALDLSGASDVTEVVVADSRVAMAHAAAAFYDNPSQAFALVGVTGTNGKTTTVYLVEHIARSAGMKTGLIGTVGIRIGDEFVKSVRTTPESPDLEKAFADMRDAHVEVAAMEVSSHALDLSRTRDAHFAVTAFTNLTQDHLDYHHTLEAYFEAKARLFSPEYPARRVICVDDEWGRELARRCNAAGDDVLTAGFDEGALIHPISIDYDTARTDLVLDVGGRRREMRYPLVGRFNVANVMCAYGIAMALGIDEEAVVRALADAPDPPGRLERVTAAGYVEGEGSPAADGFAVDDSATADGSPAAAGDVSVYVDYAHTPDALAKAIEAIRTLGDSRVIVVFGCGGDRDATKRPIMGKAALAADYAIVTSDNPRHEDPLAIIADVVAGMGDDTTRFEVVADRRAAIARAIELAEPPDCVLIAGKGHEDYQIVGDEVLDLDDRLVAAEQLARRAHMRGRDLAADSAFGGEG